MANGEELVFSGRWVWCGKRVERIFSVGLDYLRKGNFVGWIGYLNTRSLHFADHRFAMICSGRDDSVVLAAGFFVFLCMLTHRRHRRLGVILPVFVFGPPFSLGAVMILRHAVS